MITHAEIKILRGLTKHDPVVAKIGAGEKTLLCAKWFVLELPTELFSLGSDEWDAAPLPTAPEWRKKLPEGNGEFAQPIRSKDPKDGLPFIKLISDSAIALVDVSIFEVVTHHLPEAEFRIYPGPDQPHVAIFSNSQMVGGVAQVKLKE